MSLRPSGAGYGAALRHRDFRWLLSALVVDQAGTWAYYVALAVYVFNATHSAAWVGAASIARYIPMLVLSAYGGLLADRYERTKVLLTSALISTFWMTALTVTAAMHGPALLVIVFVALTATSVVVFAPAVAAMIPELVGEEELAAANALNSTVEYTAVIVGPAIGAALVLVGGPTFAFAVNAASFAYAAFAVTRIRARSRPVDVTQGGRAGLARQLLVGLQAVISSANVATLVSFSVLASFIYGTDTVLFVVLSEQQLGTGATGFGYLMAGLGVGGLIGAAFVNRLAGTPRLALLIVGGMIVYSMPTAVMAAVHAPVVAFVIQVIRGAGTLVVDVLAVTALQRSLPKDVTARVFGVFFALVLGAISLGALVTPGLLSLFGLRGVLLGIGLLIPLAVLSIYPKLRTLDRVAAARQAELAPRVTLLGDLGLFAAAPRPVLERLAGASTELEVAAGTAVVEEGDPADALYVLESGEMAVDARGEGAVSRRVATMSAPAYFGEIGLLQGIPRTATVRALNDCRVLQINGEDFFNALTEARAGATLLEGARARLQRTTPSYRPKEGTPLAQPPAAPDDAG